MEKDKVISLLNYRGGSNSTVFTGRDTGESVRKKLELDSWDKKLKKNDDMRVIFLVPPGTTSLNPSFLLGLLYKSFKSFGSKEEFEKKYELIFEDKDPDVISVLEDNYEKGMIQAELNFHGKTGLDHIFS